MSHCVTSSRNKLHLINYFQIFVILLAFSLGIMCHLEGKYASVLVELFIVVFMTINLVVDRKIRNKYFKMNLEENSK